MTTPSPKRSKRAGETPEQAATPAKAEKRAKAEKPKREKTEKPGKREKTAKAERRERAPKPAAPASPSGPRRLPPRTVGIVAIVAVIATMGVVDRFVKRTTPTRVIPLASAGPVATADTAGSSTWICSGGEGETGASMVVVNPTDALTTGTVHFLGPAGSLGDQPLTLGAGERREIDFPDVPAPVDESAATAETTTIASVAPTAAPTTVARRSAARTASTVAPRTGSGSDAASGSASAATIVPAARPTGVPLGRGVAAVLEFDGGGVVAEHRLGAGKGAVAPCAPAASTHWYLPDGATTRDATTTLILINPFSDDAILDLSFATDRGSARPTALQGLVVPAGTVRTVDVGSFVRRRSQLAATILNRTGRIVADGVLRFDGSGTSIGSTIVSAAPARGSAWYFPSGRSSKVLRETYLLDNPGDRDVTAELTVLVAGREAEPFEIDVPARSVATFEPAEETRVPVGVDYSLVAVTPPSRPIVVARRLDARSKFRKGIASTLGGRIVANRWTLADVQANTAVDDRVAVLNATDTPAKVSVYRTTTGTADPWTPVAGLQTLNLDGGDRLDIRLGDFVELNGDAVVVVSDGAPVFVDRTRVRVRAPGDRPTKPDLTTAAGRGFLVRVIRSAVASTTVPQVSTTTAPRVTTTARPVASLLPVPASSTTVRVATTRPAGGGAAVTTVASGVSAPVSSTRVASTTPASTTGASTAPASTNPASTTPASATVTSTTPASTNPASTIPASTIPASTIPASTTVASTTIASTTIASTTVTSTTPASTTTTAPSTKVAVARVGAAATGTSSALAVPSTD